MPTQTYNSMNKVYQALTDFEIEDDSKNFPIAKINVPGMPAFIIRMVSEYDFYYVLVPLQSRMLNYFVTRFSQTQEEVDSKKLVKKINTIIKGLDDISDKKDLQKKSESLSYLFEEDQVRKEFFKGLKKLNIIKWWMSWKRYQKRMRPVDTITLFCFLWLFNFSGVKKNVKFLVDKITQDTNYQLPTVSTNFGNWDTYKAKLQGAHERAPWLTDSNN